MTSSLRIILWTATLAATPAAANEALYRDVMNNLAHEHVICSVFYTTVGVCVRVQNPVVGEQGLAKGKAMFERAYLMTERAGMKPETVLARAKLEQADMIEVLGKNCANVSILLEKHGAKCKSLAADFTPRARELMQILSGRDKKH